MKDLTSRLAVVRAASMAAVLAALLGCAAPRPASEKRAARRKSDQSAAQRRRYEEAVSRGKRLLEQGLVDESWAAFREADAAPEYKGRQEIGDYLRRLDPRNEEDLLPADTLAFIQLNDTPGLGALLGGMAPGGSLIRAMARGSALSAKDAGALDGVLRRLRTVRISFHKEPRGKTTKALFFGDCAKESKKVGELLSGLGPSFKRSSNGPLTIYEFRNPKARKRVFMTEIGGRFVMATDRGLLDGVFAALRSGRADSLARVKGYARLTRGLGRSGVRVYVSARALADLATTLRAGGEVEAEALVGIVKGPLCIQCPYPVRTLRARWLVDRGNGWDAFLAGLRPINRVRSDAPKDTVYLVAVGMKDGRISWRQFSRALGRTILKARGAKAQQSFQARLRAGAKRMGGDFGDLCSLLGEAAVFYRSPGKGRQGCFLGLARSPKDARELRKLITSGRIFSQRRPVVRDKDNTRVVSYEGRKGEPVAAFYGAYALLSRDKDAAAGLLRAGRDGETLDANELWRKLAPYALKDAGALFYVDVAGALLLFRPKMTIIKMSAPQRALVNGLAFAMTSTVKGGVVNVKVASTKPMTIEQLIGLAALW